jgi:hypothetical protein
MQNPQFAFVHVSQGVLLQESAVTLGAEEKNSLETQTKTYCLQGEATHGSLETSGHQCGFSVLPAEWESLLHVLLFCFFVRGPFFISSFPSTYRGMDVLHISMKLQMES